MKGDSIEVRYSSPQTGYITEHIPAQSVQGAINLIRSRVPDATINSVELHTAEQDRRNDGGRR